MGVATTWRKPMWISIFPVSLCFTVMLFSWDSSSDASKCTWWCFSSSSIFWPNFQATQSDQTLGKEKTETWNQKFIPFNIVILFLKISLKRIMSNDNQWKYDCQFFLCFVYLSHFMNILCKGQLNHPIFVLILQALPL